MGVDIVEVGGTEAVIADAELFSGGRIWGRTNEITLRKMVEIIMTNTKKLIMTPKNPAAFIKGNPFIKVFMVSFITSE